MRQNSEVWILALGVAIFVILLFILGFVVCSAAIAAISLTKSYMEAMKKKKTTYLEQKAAVLFFP